jgi:hypothetical protein
MTFRRNFRSICSIVRRKLFAFGRTRDYYLDYTKNPSIETNREGETDPAVNKKAEVEKGKGKGDFLPKPFSPSSTPPMFYVKGNLIFFQNFPWQLPARLRT